MNREPTAAQFLNIIDNHEFSNVYFLYGEDHFLSDKVIRKLIDRYAPREGREFDLINLAGEECSSQHIIEQLEMYPFLSEYKVVVVRGFEQLKDSDQNKVADYIKDISPTAILIVHCATPTVDKRRRLFKSFAKHVTIEAKQPGGYWDIERWLQAELRNLRINASRESIVLFSSKIEADYYTAYNELEKLLIYIGAKKTITPQDIEECMGDNRANSVFELQNAIGARDKQKSLFILHNYLEAEEGKNAILLLVMLTRFFQIIWKVKYHKANRVSDNVIQSQHLNEIHPAFKNDYITYANRYSRIKMSRVFDLLLTADYKLKSTDIDVNILLTKLVVDIIG